MKYSVTDLCCIAVFTNCQTGNWYAVVSLCDLHTFYYMFTCWSF